MNQSQQIYLAPIQGLFNYHFRKVLTRHVKGIDKYFTPFIKTHGLDIYEERDLREVIQSLECPVKTVPQVMGNNPDLVVSLCTRIQELGFDEINLNLGCPHPTITKKTMGSGLLPNPEMIDAILDAVYSNLDIAFSTKIRIGLEDKSELEKLIPVLNNYPLHEVIVHPRIGLQKYEGDVDLDAFAVCLEEIESPLVYNGNIVTTEDFNNLKQRFPQINTWMIGRGIAVNPFLAETISAQTPFDKKRFAAFHHDLMEEYTTSYTGGEMQTVLKMIEHWNYFIQNFPGCEKKFKAIKKSRKIAQLESVCKEIIFSEQ